MEQKLKTSKGITLIALIVTIVVLLILATVTIKLLVDNGVIGRATGAKNKYKVAEEKELIQLAYSDYKMGVSEGSPTLEDKSLLERYFLGEDKQGKTIYDFMIVPEEPDEFTSITEIKFKDNEIIKDATTSMTLIGIKKDYNIGSYFLKYNNNIWKVITLDKGSTHEGIITNIEFVTTISSDKKDDDELELLTRYFLGEDKKGLDFNALFDYSYMTGSSTTGNMSDIKFKNNSIIQDANNNISIIAMGFDRRMECCIVKYKENFYKMFLTYSQQEDRIITTEVEFVTSIGVTKDLQLAVKGAQVVGNENTGWTITFNKTKNVYTLASTGKTSGGIDKTEDLALLKKYFLGKNGEGKLVKDVCYCDEYRDIINFNDIYGFKNDNNSIKNANTKISFLFSEYYDKIEKSDNYIKYNDVVYKVEINKEGRIINVETEYMPIGREGQTVKYSYDGTKEHEKYWTILHDYGDGVVEILSPEALGELTLGAKDEETQNPGDVDKDGTANTDIDKAIYSYNNAVSRLNRYASSLITNPNKISVRSVGSNPENPDAEGEMYTSSNLENWYNGRYNGLGKGTDDNFKEDFIRMRYWGVSRAEYEEGVGSGSLGNGDVNTGYWLASRNIGNQNGNEVSFVVRFVYNGGDYDCSSREWGVDKLGPYSLSHNYTVRPVVKISADSIK